MLAWLHAHDWLIPLTVSASTTLTVLIRSATLLTGFLAALRRAVSTDCGEIFREFAWAMSGRTKRSRCRHRAACCQSSGASMVLSPAHPETPDSSPKDHQAQC